MLNQQTIEKLYAMRMRGMADAFTQQQEDPADHATQLRGALRPAGGPPVELAAEPGAGAAAQRRPAARPSLHGRHRLPCGAGSGQAGGPLADPRLGLGAPPPTHFPGGPDRDWEDVSGAGVRAEGLPRRIHRLLRHGRAVVSGTGTGAGGWQLCQAAAGAWARWMC